MRARPKTYSGFFAPSFSAKRRSPPAIAVSARTPMVLYVLMALVGIGWSAVVRLPFAIMSEKVDKSRMGFFMGLFNLSVVLPQLVATAPVAVH